MLPFTVHDDTQLPDPPKPEDDSDEVFQSTADGVEFRTVGWFKASVLFLKVVFAVGVLSLPTTLNTLGAVGGTLCVLGFGIFNTYCFVIVGNFRERHRGCHSIADTAGVVGGPICREIAGIFFIIGNLLGTSSAIIGLGTAFNALSYHAICTVAWNVISAVIIALPAALRRFQDIGWVTYVGFVSIYAAVLIVVVGVTQRDRPAAAPPIGDFDLGFSAIKEPTFAAGMVAASTIFYSSSGTSAFLPIMSEMRNPKDYKKALYLCMIIVNASYIAFSMVMYKWAGKWIADPSLGVSPDPFSLSIIKAVKRSTMANPCFVQTAGQTVKMVAYGVGLPGLIASGCIFLHVGTYTYIPRFPIANSCRSLPNTYLYGSYVTRCTSRNLQLCTGSAGWDRSLPSSH